jgi:hypothetical protein
VLTAVGHDVVRNFLDRVGLVDAGRTPDPDADG